MKTYYYFVRYSCYDRRGLIFGDMIEFALDKEIQSIADVRLIADTIREDFLDSQLNQSTLVVDFFTLLRIEG